MSGVVPDASTVRRAIFEKALPNIQTALKNHLIYCEGDLQAIVYWSIIDFLQSRGFDMTPVRVANLRYMKGDFAEEGFFPDIIVFYYNDPLYVIELKDNINRRVGKEELTKDFHHNALLARIGVFCTVLLITARPLPEFEQLEKEYVDDSSANLQIALDTILNEVQVKEWREEHEAHVQRVQRFLSSQR